MSSGRLRVLVAAASGAGTSYAMLDEGVRRRSRGARVLVHPDCAGGRPLTTELHERLLASGATTAPDSVEEMLALRPDVVLLDDLARDPTTAETARRLVESGVDVVGTLTIDHVAQLEGRLRDILGTVSTPRIDLDSIDRSAQVEVVDITPEAIQRRIAHGNVMPADADPTTVDVYDTDVFTALRSLTLEWMVDRIRPLPSNDHAARLADDLAPPPRAVVRPHERWPLVLAVSVVVLVGLTVVLVAIRSSIAPSTALSTYLLAVVLISAFGGRTPGLLAAVAAPLLANWYLIEPYHTLRIADPENALELVVFVSVAVVVSSFVAIAARRAADAEAARRETALLAALAGTTGADALDDVLAQLCTALDVRGAAVWSRSSDSIVASAGAEPPSGPHGCELAEPIDEDSVLLGTGRRPNSEQRRMLSVFVAHLATSLEQRRTARLASEADALARADELRTAILRAVSHDLRSPLASIKACVSSLRQTDVDWPPEARDEFLAAVEDETDRLTTIVSNLLDMSRLEAGVLSPIRRMVSLEEVVPAALHSLGARASVVELAIPAELPDVDTDPALLERVLANVVGNAIEFSPGSVKVTAAERDGNIGLFVIDRGPGIHPRDRDLVVQPFHRLTDQASNSGVGLGLAIADRLTAAMGGRLELRDTPGGGLTVLITLPRAAGGDTR